MLKLGDADDRAMDRLVDFQQIADVAGKLDPALQFFTLRVEDVGQSGLNRRDGFDQIADPVALPVVAAGVANLIVAAAKLLHPAEIKFKIQDSRVAAVLCGEENQRERRPVPRAAGIKQQIFERIRGGHTEALHHAVVRRIEDDLLRRAAAPDDGIVRGDRQDARVLPGADLLKNADAAALLRHFGDGVLKGDQQRIVFAVVGEPLDLRAGPDAAFDLQAVDLFHLAVEFIDDDPELIHGGPEAVFRAVVADARVRFIDLEAGRGGEVAAESVNLTVLRHGQIKKAAVKSNSMIPLAEVRGQCDGVAWFKRIQKYPSKC